jgi:cysteine-rich repeat protein
VVDPMEDCEPAPVDSDCRTDCRYPRCGDAVVDLGEACDEGEANSDEAPDACRKDCRLARCGDGVRDEGEGCDDGNRAAGDGCTPDCEGEPLPPTGGQEAPQHPVDAAAPKPEPAPTDAGTWLDAGVVQPTDTAAPSTPTPDAGSSTPRPAPEAGRGGDSSANPEGALARESGCACRLGTSSAAGWHWLLYCLAACMAWARRERAHATK